jgi:hypothetical protein
MKRLSIALVLAAASAGATGQAFRWVDENGKVHYGDRPPSNSSTYVRGTRNAKAPDGGPIAPGMTPDEVRTAFGKPDDVRTVTTRMGQVQYWNYRKPPKGQKTGYTIKFEGGQVSEVTTEQSAQAAIAPVPTGPATAPSGAVGAGPAVQTVAGTSQQSQQDRAAAARERECASVRDRARDIDARMRAGATGQQMDRMREERRKQDQKLSELGC